MFELINKLRARTMASRVATAGLLLCVVACAGGRAAAPPSAITVKLIAFNDFHGQLTPPTAATPVPDPTGPQGKTLNLPTGGVLYLSGLVKQLKAQNALHAVIGAGDLIGGSPLVSSLFHDEPTIEALSALGLEFSSVGNHEFDEGVDELLRMQNGGCLPGGAGDTCLNDTFKGAGFRYLAANVIDAVGQTLFPPYAVKRFDLDTGRTLEIAFIGLVLRRTPQLVVPEAVKGLKFVDEAQAANALVRQLRARGIETIVLLIHEGGATSANTFDDPTCPGFYGDILAIIDMLDPAIDVVVTGHTHKAFVCSFERRLITSAGAQGRFVTDIDLRIDPRSNDVVGASARQLAVVNDTAPNPLPARYPAISPDMTLAPLLKLYSDAANPFIGRVIASIETDITRAKNEAGESALGNLIADAQLAATHERGAQIAFVNMEGMRADLIVGDGWISYGEAFAVHPFGNELVTLTLTGAQIDELLELQWTRASTILQISNDFSYEWNPAATAGQKIDAASIKLNGATIDPTATYLVTVNEFLAGGGDNFSVLASASDRRRSTRTSDIDALEKYLTTHSPVSAPTLNRIRRLGR